jgi:hypothetical protein
MADTTEHDEGDYEDLLVVCEVLLRILILEEETASEKKKNLAKKKQHKKHNPSSFDQRLSWSSFCNKRVPRGTFKRCLRMTNESFDKLLSYVYDELLVKEQMADMCGGSIIPEICLHCAL